MSLVWQHWTKHGTFKIEPVSLLGTVHFVLWCGELNLGTYSYPQTAAKSIGDGKHDKELGVNASTLGVPSRISEWNGFN
jgi:hypothetical protein